MSRFKTITQEPNFDVSAGVTNFDTVRIESDDNVTVQVFYNGLDAEDLNVRIEQSLEESDPPDFNDVVDPNGSLIEKNLESADTSHTFNITGFVTDLARLVIQSVGGVTQGTITKIIWRIQK